MATTAPQPTATTSSGGATSGGGAPTPTPYAYAAPAHIAELDARFSNPPPIPPNRSNTAAFSTWPLAPDMDPIRIRDSEWYVVWDQLLEWEAQWYFPEVQKTPTICPNLAESWEMVDVST